MSIVNIGDVKTFKLDSLTKDYALKPLEEAAEIYGAYQDFSKIEDDFKRKEAAISLLNECADTIQATCNVVAALELELGEKISFTDYMMYCQVRNTARGRM